MAETIVLDPVEVADNRTQLDLTKYVGASGPDWGDAAIEQFLSDAGIYGQVPIDYTIPNRVVSIPLVLHQQGDVPFETIRRQVQQKVARFQNEGGWLKRTTAIGPVFAEIVSASLKMGGGTAQAMLEVDADAVLTLTTLPDWFGDETRFAAFVGQGSVSQLLPDTVGGDLPARARVIVTDESGVDQHGVLWAFRSRHYSAQPTAALLFNAADLTPLGAASVASVGGEYCVRLTSIPKSADPYTPVWSPVVNTLKTVDGHLSHVGLHRVWARVRAPSTGGGQASSIRLRLSWENGISGYGVLADSGTGVIDVSGHGAQVIVDSRSGTINLSGSVARGGRYARTFGSKTAIVTATPSVVTSGRPFFVWGVVYVPSSWTPDRQRVMAIIRDGASPPLRTGLTVDGNVNWEEQTWGYAGASGPASDTWCFVYCAADVGGAYKTGYAELPARTFHHNVQSGATAQAARSTSLAIGNWRTDSASDWEFPGRIAAVGMANVYPSQAQVEALVDSNGVCRTSTWKSPGYTTEIVIPLDQAVHTTAIVDKMGHISSPTEANTTVYDTGGALTIPFDNNA